MVMDRRGLLSLLAAGSAAFLWAGPAAATVARALTLRELLSRSTSVLVLTPLARASSWEVIGGSRRIVTDTRARVDELVSGADPKSSEVLVRTLGGRIGKIGQLVSGEAELELGEDCLLFGREFEPARFGVAAMAQGHYPLVTQSGGKLVRASRQLPALVGQTEAAFQRLSGKSLADALRLVRAEAR